MSNANDGQEWRIVEAIYKADTERITHQLQFCLIFRGWAITIFVGMLTALIVYRIPMISLAGIIALLLFFYSECRYDSRRIIFLKRINDVEENFLCRKIEDLKVKLNISKNVMTRSFPLFSDEELTYDLKKAEKLAAKRPTRLWTYTLLIVVLVVFGIAAQLYPLF